MSHLLFWPSITSFYPIGNTSAVCLTENLPPGCKADILLPGCGDPRHILYTIYTNETSSSTYLRTFDITCCDVDVAILARNALLFTFLADDGGLDQLDSIWKLFYHMLVDETSLSILFQQCRKLVGLAESTEMWRAGPYGHFLTTCDAATLAELRRIWTTYLDTANWSSKQAERFKRQFIDGMKENSRSMGFLGAIVASHSAGPLAIHVDETVSHQFNSYWSSGITDDGAQGQKRRLLVNPTFAFSIEGSKFAVHNGTDPLSGFHLAEAFTSGKFTRPNPREDIPPHEVVRIAKDQFSRWCTSMSKCLKSSNPLSPTFIIRMFAGDALMFCQALKFCEVTRSPVTPYNVAVWRLSNITFDDHYYGRYALSPAPLWFNVIDTLNLSDHVGLVNVLVVTVPLLRKTQSATLYTETLLDVGDNPSQAILEHVCGDVPTMALLLGIIPSTFISQFTTRSNAHETLMMMMDKGTPYYERLAWKVIGLGGTTSWAHCHNTPIPCQRLSFPPEELAAFLSRVYLNMFSDEDLTSQFQLFTLSPRTPQELQRSAVVHYTPRSFALLVQLIKTRVQTDWSRVMDLLEDFALTDGSLILGFRELSCHLHLLGIYTAPWMSIPAVSHLEQMSTLGLFHDWTQTHIPQVVTLVLIVPRDALSRLEPNSRDFGTPVLQCDVHSGPIQTQSTVISATFGTLHVSGTGEHRTGAVVEDTVHPPWQSKAPLIVTFSVPSATVMACAPNPVASVGLMLRETPGMSARFALRPGVNSTIFRTQLGDADHVYVLAQHPVARTSTSTGIDPGMAIAASGQWQANDSDPSTSSLYMRYTTHPDMHVQMNSMLSAVQSFTTRIEIKDPSAQATLAASQTVPTASSSSVSSLSHGMCVKIGTHAYSVQFPLPVDVARAKLRVERRPSYYIEVVVPPAPTDVRAECDVSRQLAFLSLDSNNDGSPTLGSIHRVNLDRCPAFKLPPNPPTYNWCNAHVNFMYSEHEKRAPEVEPGCSVFPYTLLRVKATLDILLCSAAGANTDGQPPESLFALFDISREMPYLYIIVARVCLDIGSHTFAADAFVAPSTRAVREALGIVLSPVTMTASGSSRHVDGYRTPSQGLQTQDEIPIKYITTDTDESRAWFHLLPRLIERSRTWSHTVTCTSHTSKRRQQQQKPEEGSLGTWDSEGQNPLCTCGAGVGTEILPERFARIAPLLTRAAFSPLFPVPCLEEADASAGGPDMGSSLDNASASGPYNSGIGKAVGVAVGYPCLPCGKVGGLRCSGCKRARYCSKVCQRADWKIHKKDCGST